MDIHIASRTYCGLNNNTGHQLLNSRSRSIVQELATKEPHRVLAFRLKDYGGTSEKDALNLETLWDSRPFEFD